MQNLGNVLKNRIAAQKLAILVFGPDPKGASDKKSAFHKLAKKRIEIRDRLRADGHTAEFPEDLLVGINTPPRGQVLNYQEVLVESHDLVIMLIGSPGSNNEIGRFSAKTPLAEKTQAFLASEHKGGLADDTCASLISLGGEFHYFANPGDLDSCHLLGKVTKIVNTLQRRKLYS